MTLADALESANFSDGDVIIKQGDAGSEFFIIMEGTVVVTQTNDAGETGEVARLGTSKYFGKLVSRPRSCPVPVRRLMEPHYGTLPTLSMIRLLSHHPPSSSPLYYALVTVITLRRDCPTEQRQAPRHVHGQRRCQVRQGAPGHLRAHPGPHL